MNKIMNSIEYKKKNSGLIKMSAFDWSMTRAYKAHDPVYVTLLYVTTYMQDGVDATCLTQGGRTN
jgi:hypothetical protein